MNELEIFESFWHRFSWLNQGKLHRESARLAFIETVKPYLCDQTKEETYVPVLSDG